jgi:hypothetical protein
VWETYDLWDVTLALRECGALLCLEEGGRDGGLDGGGEYVGWGD